MTINDIILLLSLLVSLGALIVSLAYNRTTHVENAYERFLSFWIEMDSCFIEHPSVHKYFYDCEWNNRLPDEGSSEYELALCIAEKFRDVFQYSEQIARDIPKKYKASYYDYMNRIMNTAIYKRMDEKNPIAYSSNHRIGSEYLVQK